MNMSVTFVINVLSNNWLLVSCCHSVPPRMPRSSRTSLGTLARPRASPTVSRVGSLWEAALHHAAQTGARGFTARASSFVVNFPLWHENGAHSLSFPPNITAICPELPSLCPPSFLTRLASVPTASALILLGQHCRQGTLLSYRNRVTDVYTHRPEQGRASPPG